MIAQSILAMEPIGGKQPAGQGLFRSLVYRNTYAAKIGDIERVPSSLLDGDIARDGRDGNHVGVFRPQRHDQRDSVVRCGIGVDQYPFGHASQNTKRYRI